MKRRPAMIRLCVQCWAIGFIVGTSCDAAEIQLGPIATSFGVESGLLATYHAAEVLSISSANGTTLSTNSDADGVPHRTELKRGAEFQWGEPDSGNSNLSAFLSSGPAFEAATYSATACSLCLSLAGDFRIDQGRQPVVAGPAEDVNGAGRRGRIAADMAVTGLVQILDEASYLRGPPPGQGFPSPLIVVSGENLALDTPAVLSLTFRVEADWTQSFVVGGQVEFGSYMEAYVELVKEDGWIHSGAVGTLEGNSIEKYIDEASVTIEVPMYIIDNVNVFLGLKNIVLTGFSNSTNANHTAFGDFSLYLSSISLRIAPEAPPEAVITSVRVVAVPEPGKWACLALGIACLGLIVTMRRGAAVG